MDKTVSDNCAHLGHRGRMRAKLMAHGHEIFDTYELLEMLLYHAVPCKDTNPIAKRLLSRFGSLDAVLRAAPEELMEVEGVGARCAEIICRAGDVGDLVGVRLAGGEKLHFSNYKTAGEYFADYFSNSKGYAVALMILDNSLRMVDAITLSEDKDYCSASIRPERVVAHALKLRAAAVMTAHSHPNGPLFPSHPDKITNDAVTSALDALGILHLEHYVVSGREYLGIMNHLKERFSASSKVYSFLESKELAITSDIGLMEVRDE